MKTKMIAVKVMFTENQIKEIDRLAKGGVYGNKRTDVVYQAVALRFFG